MGPLRWRQALEDQGLTVRQEEWTETLELELSENLLNRWLAPEGSYRRQLRNLSESAFTSVAQRLRRSLGQRLPQELRHSLLIAERC
jgi:cell wall assembly regulator SMI1